VSTVKPASKLWRYALTTVLRARLLGALEVELDGTAIDSPATQRPWAVFAYLALAGRRISRAELASAFWPDVLDQSARASLRSALWSLRRQIGEALVVEGDHVELRDLEWVDIRDADARELCAGELLEGVEDEWVLQARERHRERVVELLEEQAKSADQAEAIRLTRLQTERAPFDEQAHRRLMERLSAAGDRAAALRVFAALGERLRRELGVAPSAATRELAEQLRAEAPARRTTLQPPTGLLTLVGRQRELEALERQWRAAASGRGSVALIRGEAGIGKTRLATELRLRAAQSGARTAACAALDLGGTAPLSLWAELIRELLPALPAPPADAAWPADLAVLVSELPGHFGRSATPTIAVAPDLQRTRLFEAVVALLGWAARDTPLLLVLEDAHDADPASLELAGYAARRVAELPVLMLVTRRQLPASADADRLEQALRARGLVSCELSLGPLSAEAVTALARKAARLDDTELHRVVERAEGNPLLAVETARMIHEQVAPSIRGSVRAMLAPLTGDARRLIELAAVATRPLSAVEVDDLELDASGALETGLLISDGGRLQFRHALLREAAYEEIAEPRRRSMHRLWAARAQRPDEAARHLRLAGADQEAVPQLVLAAADARAVAALDQAVAYLQEALAISPEHADAWLELGELEAWRGRRVPSEEAFRRGIALLESDRLALARAWLRQSRAYHGPICVPRAVLESARKALDLLDEHAIEERSEALAACAWAEAVAGSVDEAERLLLELDATPHADDDLRTYDVGHARALTLMRRGRFVESYGPSIAAGDAITRAGRPDLAYGCWANAAAAATAADEWERALEFIDRGMAAPAQYGLQSLEIHLFGARAFVLRGLGRLEEALAATDSQQALAEQMGRSDMLAMATHDRGLVELEAGHFESAAELLSASLIDGAPISRPLTRLALAEALARSGRPDAAAEQVRETVLEPLAPSDFPDALVPRLARAQGLIAQARGEPAEAERRLEEAIAGWERLLERTVRAESITSVLADLGRPVVGLIEPERELARARADLEAIKKGSPDAIVS
jgi:DNA-binding SARP family transcriptional activator/tetratricopeptide (TPR) repeat protein